MLILSALTAPKESARCFTANGMKTSARLESPATITKRNCKKKKKKEETLQRRRANRSFSLSCLPAWEAELCRFTPPVHVKYSAMRCTRTFINLMVDANFLIKEGSTSPSYTEPIHNQLVLLTGPEAFTIILSEANKRSQPLSRCPAPEYKCCKVRRSYFFRYYGAD